MKTYLNYVYAVSLAALQLAFFSPVSASAQTRSGNPLDEWCNRADLVLRNAKHRAEIASSTGDTARAKLELLAGLKQVESGNPMVRSAGLLTARSVNRALTLASEIEDAVQGAPNGLRTTVYFLYAEYEFILGVVQDLDVQYRIPAWRCHHCNTYDPEQYEVNFLAYSRASINLIQQTLASEGQGYVTPVGPVTAYLKAMELAAQYAVQDLTESLWAYSFSCEIQELNRVGRTLSAFNSGDSSAYANSFEAMNSAYFDIHGITARLYPSCGCSFR